MRTWVGPSSPWGQRLYFEPHEFDAMMDEVRTKAGQETIVPGTGVDVEAIFERVFKVVPDYGELPDGVLGKTVFHRDGRFEIILSRELSDASDSDPVARRRLRATAAHECAHVVEHGHLHLVDNLTGSLFGVALAPPPRVLCRNDSINRPGYGGEWWEYQANRGMSALLLPKRLVANTVQDALAAEGLASMDEALRRQAVEPLVRKLMDTFDVSMQLVTYRLQELGTLPRSTAQTTIAMEVREAN
jgi:hypothetical protein